MHLVALIMKQSLLKRGAKYERIIFVYLHFIILNGMQVALFTALPFMLLQHLLLNVL